MPPFLWQTHLTHVISMAKILQSGYSLFSYLPGLELYLFLAHKL
jgi:hypothetical protein